MVLVPHEVKLIGFGSYLQCQCKIIEALIMSPHSAREYCLSMLEFTPELRATFLHVEQQLKVTGLPPGGVQDFVDNVLKHYKVPEIGLGIFCVGLGLQHDPRTVHLADTTVRCAEDNALVALKNLRQGRTVAEIKWVSVAMDTGLYKPLCPFCQVAFK